MGEFLEENFLGLVGLLVALIVGLIPVILYILDKKRKELSYEVISNTPLITNDEEVRKNIKIMFEDREIKEDVSLVLVRIVNTGNVPILPEDITEDIVIESNFNNILSADLKETSPSNLKVQIDRGIRGFGIVSISPLLLNSKDEIILKLLITEYENELVVKGRIVGVKEIIKVKEKTSSKLIPFLYPVIGVNILFFSNFTFFSGLLAGNIFEILTVIAFGASLLMFLNVLLRSLRKSLN